MRGRIFAKKIHVSYVADSNVAISATPPEFSHSQGHGLPVRGGDGHVRFLSKLPLLKGLETG